MSKITIEYSPDDIDQMLIEKLATDYGIRGGRGTFSTKPPINVDISWSPDRSVIVKVGSEVVDPAYKPTFTIEIPEDAADAESTSSTD